MKLSSKSLTAIKMFVDLGEHYQDDFISLVDIASRKEVSKKFLEQIVIPYKKAGLLIGSRGNQGGYKLARAPHLINLKEIIEVSENSLFEKQNEGNLIKEILKELDQRIDEYFSSITLSSLVDKQIASYGNSYSI
jgi:Rrf2 family protein